jgi:hypothetical protein
MKTTQYVRQEKAIAAADKGGIRERWVWGLRLLRDPEAMSSEKSLKHGVTDQLIAAATASGLKLSDREIRYRLQCARAYPTEAEIGNVIADFDTWFDLIQAGFPSYEVPDDEPPADHRTDAERKRDHARAALDLIGEQGTLFPLDQFEPVETTLKELQNYTQEMEELTARFAARDAERRAYLDKLVAAADNDLSMTWRDAQDRLNATDASATDQTMADEDPPLDEDCAA